jgi:hypothetical protein
VTEVGNMAEKKTLLQMLENLKQKRAWVVYDVMRSRLVEVIICLKLHIQHEGAGLYIQNVMGSDLSLNTGYVD